MEDWKRPRMRKESIVAARRDERSGEEMWLEALWEVLLPLSGRRGVWEVGVWGIMAL